jgi:hypothetical protein
LSIALHATRQLWDPPLALLWEAGLSSLSCSQPLLLFPHLFTESSALRVQLLAPSPFSGGRLSVPPPSLLLVLEYNSLFVLFSFVGGRDSICPGAVLDYVPKGIGRGVTCGA